MRNYRSILIAWGVALVFLISPVMAANESDDQCDYLPFVKDYYTWDRADEFNLDATDNWISLELAQQGYTFFEMLQNPDPLAEIQCCVLVMNIYGGLYRYWWFDSKNQLYVFDFDSNKLHYTELAEPPEGSDWVFEQVKEYWWNRFLELKRDLSQPDPNLPQEQKAI